MTLTNWLNVNIFIVGFVTSDCVIVPRREVKGSKVVQSKISNWQHWQCHWQRPITLIVNVCDARLCVGRWSFGHPAATPYLYQPSGASQLFRWIIFSAPHIFGNFVFFPDISFLFSARPSVMWLMMTDCCHVVYCVLDSAHILLNLSLSWFLFNGQKFVEGFRKKDSFLQGSNFLKRILPMICNMTLCYFFGEAIWPRLRRSEKQECQYLEMVRGGKWKQSQNVFSKTCFGKEVLISSAPMVRL